MSCLLGDEYADLVAAMGLAPVGGLRVNRLKISGEEFAKKAPFPYGAAIPWCTDAFILAGEERLGKHPWHLAGLYYLQDPSAMTPANFLDPKPGERVLDLTAAPGGKTTQMATLMQGRGMLVANEIKDKRLGHLVMNVERWGAGNVVITNETPEHLADHFGAVFDRVLVDAPCSGEGMFRKDMGARLDWSPEMVVGCSVRQQNIMRVAAHLVRPGGRLLYSTCTFAPEENEGVITKFLQEHADFQVQALPLMTGFLPGQPEWLAGTDLSLRRAVRLFPHRVQGEGHFVCLLQRGDGAVDRERASDTVRMAAMGREQSVLWNEFRANTLVTDLPIERMKVRGDRLYLVPEGMSDFGSLRVVHPGVWLGNFKKGRFKPAHPLAMTIKADQVWNVEDMRAEDPRLTKYLRGETLPSAGETGWVLVSVDGYGLGWGKRVEGIIKNHYPRGWM